MTDRMPNQIPPVSDTLRRDLELVLPDTCQVRSLAVAAFAKGTPVTAADAIVRAGELIDASKCPVMCGLTMLTIEALRQAGALVRKVDMRMIVWPTPTAPTDANAAKQTATLGEVLACDLVIRLDQQDDTACHPIVAAVADRLAAGAFVALKPDDLAKLHTQLKEPEQVLAVLAGIVGRPVRRMTLLVPPEPDPEMIRLWDELATQCRKLVRIFLFPLANMTTAGNERGAVEVIAWQTGSARTCEAHQIADADLLVEAGLAHDQIDRPLGVPRIHIGQACDAKADLSFVVPGPALGLAARVMRCDGIVLWLCDDPATAPADPCVDLLQQIERNVTEPT